jgi:hypothetical protein
LSAFAFAMSERDARGPEDDDKPGFILGGSVSSPVQTWSREPVLDRDRVMGIAWHSACVTW